MDKKVMKECSDKLKNLRQEVLSSLSQLSLQAEEIGSESDGDEIDKSANLSELDRIKNLRQQYSMRIRMIDGAESRMSSGSFGICALCEEDIPKKRLLANPLSIRCVSCQEEQEMEDKENGKRFGKSAPGSFTDDTGDSGGGDDE